MKTKVHVEHLFTSSYKKAINQILSEMVFCFKSSREKYNEIFLVFILKSRFLALKAMRYLNFCDFFSMVHY